MNGETASPNILAKEQSPPRPHVSLVTAPAIWLQTSVQLYPDSLYKHLLLRFSLPLHCSSPIKISAVGCFDSIQLLRLKLLANCPPMRYKCVNNFKPPCKIYYSYFLSPYSTLHFIFLLSTLSCHSPLTDSPPSCTWLALLVMYIEKFYN